MVTLECKECGHINEGERIYCHNCGTKLDRSVLPKPAENAADRVREQRRVLRMTNPKKGLLAGVGWMLIETVFWAALVAALIQIVRPPEGVPPYTPGLVDAPPIAMALEQALESPQPQRILLTEQAINNYLQNSVRQKAGAGWSSELKFVRAYVKLDKGVCRIFTQQSVFGYNLFASTAYSLTIARGQVQAKSVGGSLGRLPIHTSLMETGAILFKKLWRALDREHKLLNRMRAVEIEKGEIVLVTRGAA